MILKLKNHVTRMWFSLTLATILLRRSVLASTRGFIFLQSQGWKGGVNWGASIKPDDFEMKPLRGCKEHGWNICVVTDMFFDFRLFPFLVFANHCTHATNFPKSTVCLGW